MYGATLTRVLSITLFVGWILGTAAGCSARGHCDWDFELEVHTVPHNLQPTPDTATPKESTP